MLITAFPHSTGEITLRQVKRSLHNNYGLGKWVKRIVLVEAMIVQLIVRYAVLNTRGTCTSGSRYIFIIKGVKV